MPGPNVIHTVVEIQSLILIKLAKSVKSKSLFSICSHVTLKVKGFRARAKITTEIFTLTMKIPAVHRGTTKLK